MVEKTFNRKLLVLGTGALIIGALFLYNRPQPLSNLKEIGESQQQTQIQEMKQDQSAQPKPEITPESHPIDLSAASERDQKLIQELDQIILSKNDNDPRIDKDFKGMSQALHRLLEEKYNSYPLEKRAERGMIAFLLARDMSTVQDVDFINQVFSESPCLSLEDCSAPPTSSDPHHTATDQMSLNYPQMAALYQFEKKIQDQDFLSKSGMKDHVNQALDQAMKSSVPLIVKKAEQARKKIR
ncbi:MAG: hypothetical protein BroJett041_23890 [Candidatus Jettenia caeni]|nr:MAG: hypothetical protein BroJett041_23890 [Candidatus Jettenia caeni]